MAYTLGDIATKVRTRIRDTGYSPTETIQYINDTVNDVFNEYRLPFMQATQSYTVTVNVSDITNGNGLPTNFVQAIDMIVTTAGKERVLRFIDTDELEESFPDLDDTTLHPAGDPQYAYKYGNTIRVFPAPSTAYSVSLRYYKKPTVMTADGNVPEIPSEFEELLVVGAAYRILQVKDNYDQAGILENKYGELLQKLVVRYSQDQVGSPHIMRINRGRTTGRQYDSIRRIG